MSVFSAVSKKLAEGAQTRFFSQAARSAENLQRKTGNAAGFKNDLTGKGQVKPDELKAMGFDEHFGDRKDITKEEVQQFINENQVQIKETVLGKPLEDRYVVRPDPEGGFNVYDATDPSNEVLDSYGRQETAASAAETMNRNENVDTSKFGVHTLDGGDNYRELLMSLPRKAHPDQGKLDELLRSQDSEDYLSDLLSSSRTAKDEWVVLDQKHSDLVWSEGGDDLTGAKLEEANQLYKKVQAAKVKWKQIDISLAQRRGDLREQIVDLQHEIHQEKRGQEFVNSSHFDEPNILAHLRMKDRVDADGNKTLLIEEAQSDWHQKGANDGYKTPKGLEVYEKKLTEIDQEIQDLLNSAEVYTSKGQDAPQHIIDGHVRLNNVRENLIRERNKLDDSVPDAPFKTDDKSSWYNLAMKRGLIEAAEGDYDKLAFTTGRQQAERYDLSKQINEVRLGGNERDGFTVSAFDKNDTPVIMESIDSLDALPNLIGKDAAKALVDQPLTDTAPWQVPTRVLEGQDLSVGGEGMKQFYDRTLPNTLNKLVKQDGVKVGQTTLNHPGVNLEGFNMYEASEIQRLQDLVDRGRASEIDREYLANYLARAKPSGDTVHSIDITPEMRDRVKKGLPLFAQGGAVVGAGTVLAPQDAEAGPLSQGAKRIIDQRFSNPVADSGIRKGVLANAETIPVGIEKRNMDMGGNLNIEDFEGHPYILTQSDRSAAGGTLNSVNNQEIDAVNLRGGRDFMFDPASEGQVWASFPSVVNGLHGRAGELKRQTGKNPILMPYAMAPTGIDFATMPLDAMINYARQGMSKTNIKKLDSKIKKVMPNWSGVMNPDSNSQFKNVTGDTRKAVARIIDMQFRDVNGGLSMGEARAATSASDQYLIPDGSLKNAGIIDASKPVLSDSGHPTYIGGLQGEGLGRFTDSLNARAFAEANGRNITGKPNDIRALSMNHDLQQGIIDENLLRFIEKHKKKLATAGALASGGASADQAREQQRFERLEAEDQKLREMGSSSYGKVSPELAEYRRSQLLPSIGEIGMGALEATVDGLDFLSNVPTSISRMQMQNNTPVRDMMQGILDTTFVDERDKRRREEARKVGALLSPI